MDQTIYEQIGKEKVRGVAPERDTSEPACAVTGIGTVYRPPAERQMLH